MERLAAALRAELGRVGRAEGDIAAVVAAWPRAVGDEVARRAWPARLQRGGTLLVHTVSATWAFELGRMAGDVLERLRAEAGPSAPASLRFVPGPVPEPPAPPAPAAATPSQPSPAEAARAAEVAAAIEDPELRELVRRSAAASLSRAREKGGSDLGF